MRLIPSFKLIHVMFDYNNLLVDWSAVFAADLTKHLKSNSVRNYYDKERQ